MVFEYNGFFICRIGLGGYLVTGPGLPGLAAASVAETVKIIDGVTAGRCGEQGETA